MATDSTPPPTSNDPANDGYELRNADEARRDAEDKAREAGQDKGDKPNVVEKILDKIEDAIPGDSDNDGH
jgi:hypothetical protein